MKDIIEKTLMAGAAKLAENMRNNNALLSKLLEHQAKHPPKPLTKAQIAKRKRDRKLGKKYLAMAHALGVYDDDEDW